MSGGETLTQARSVPVRPEIGEPVAPESLHVIDRPGLYGVSEPKPGMEYAVVGNSLVRIDAATSTVRSIIRGGVRPLD